MATGKDNMVCDLKITPVRDILVGEEGKRELKFLKREFSFLTPHIL